VRAAYEVRADEGRVPPGTQTVVVQALLAAMAEPMAVRMAGAYASLPPKVWTYWILADSLVR
jgi:hypothetical protein